jgi:hypothetical protein
MYWTLQNLKDSENKQQILHCGSMFSAATVQFVECGTGSSLSLLPPLSLPRMHEESLDA